MSVTIEEDADRGRNSHSQIVGHAVVADAFGTPAGGQHVDGNGRVGHSEGTKGTTMQRADDGKQQERGGRQITSEEDGEGRVADQQHGLSWKGIDNKAAERAEQQRRQRIARQHQADDVLCRTEVLAEIERQQRREDIEGKEQRKIRRHHLAIIRVPESFLCHNVCKITN